MIENYRLYNSLTGCFDGPDESITGMEAFERNLLLKQQGDRFHRWIPVFSPNAVNPARSESHAAARY